MIHKDTTLKQLFKFTLYDNETEGIGLLTPLPGAPLIPA